MNAGFIVLFIAVLVVGAAFMWRRTRQRPGLDAHQDPPNNPPDIPPPRSNPTLGSTPSMEANSATSPGEMPRIVFAERTKTIAIGRTVRSVCHTPVFALIESVESLSDAEEIAASIAHTIENAPPAFPSICEALQDAASRLLAKSVELGRSQPGGASVIALVVEPSQIRIAHVGNLRVYVARGGQVKLLTRDHGLMRDIAASRGLSDEVLCDMLEDSGAPHRRVVTRLLGNKPDVALDIISWPCRSGDTFILLSNTMALAARREMLGRLCGQSSDIESLADAVLKELGAQPSLWSDPTTLIIRVH